MCTRADANMDVPARIAKHRILIVTTSSSFQHIDAEEQGGKHMNIPLRSCKSISILLEFLKRKEEGHSQSHLNLKAGHLNKKQIVGH